MSELVYGRHTIGAILDKNPRQILKVYVVCKPRDLKLESLVNKINKFNIDVYECTRKWLNTKVLGSFHQGIVAEIINQSYLKENYLVKFLENNIVNPLLLVLDGITDPHNLGACLRSADAAGVHIVIAPKDRSVPVNATVRKVASGSTEYVSFVRVTNLSRTLKLLKKYNIRVIGTVLKSANFIFNTELRGPLALVMGSEGFGIRNITKKNCDELMSIPMSRSTMSLNISVATGICLFEILRQRNF